MTPLVWKGWEMAEKCDLLCAHDFGPRNTRRQRNMMERKVSTRAGSRFLSGEVLFEFFHLSLFQLLQQVLYCQDQHTPTLPTEYS